MAPVLCMTNWFCSFFNFYYLRERECKQKRERCKSARERERERERETLKQTPGTLSMESDMDLNPL